MKVEEGEEAFVSPSITMEEPIEEYMLDH